MFPALQPSRPKVQPPSSQTPYAHQQQRAAHEQSPSIACASPHGASSLQGAASAKIPRLQLEPMSPFAPAHSPFVTPTTMYNSAIRHPVFFTENLRKPPFPIPDVASHGWSPVANGYIVDQRRLHTSGSPKTKL